MKNKLFIHVGFPRTGTSFLQEQIFRKIPNVNFQRRNIIEQEIKPDSINIFGDESITGVLPEHRKTIIERIHKVFPDAKIIIGVRDYESWYRSLYNLYLSKGYTGTLNDVIEEDLYRDSDGYIDFVEKLYGKENVFVYDQKTMATNFGGWLKKLSYFLDIDLSFVVNKRVNQSWLPLSLTLAKRLNRYFRSGLNPEGFFPIWMRTMFFRSINIFIKYKKSFLSFDT